ncbi:VOC family protein [Saccharopolyspora sp. NFXS83]|uniref:VOC family protein n=1 Tax=Saccharopolyspora sp. NFXS83 TaxID=2993560 RepID=UPI00224A56E2|nr:VOC family protein [Saccharopolyspora sp. NFXS83]MCX2732550.1 VOC family protein [Saccharopolyspora sp. NFXS83]
MRMIFVNLPVKDVQRSKAFFAELGFGFNDEFSDEKTICMVVEENIMVMMLEHDRFAEFINGDISDATTTTEVLNCLSVDTRDQVDGLIAKAIEAGGKPWKPTAEMGPMYGGSFQDVDGHVWELVHAES